jgi:tetratricopeptide (TPR) repeat protein
VLEALCAPLADGGAFVEPASIRDMAQTLGISDAAVKQHLLQLYSKLDIHEGAERRRTRLANKAVEVGILTLGAPSSGGGAKADDPLSLARKAATFRNWRAAFDHLSRVPPAEIENSADDQELLGEAALWSGHPDPSLAARQRAYALHLQAGNGVRAAVVALSLVVNYAMRSNMSQASGWLAKARRHLDPNPEGLVYGYVQVTEALFEGFAGRLEAALPPATRALAIAEECGDADLRALSLAAHGYALCVLGRRDEGRPMLDEAMASATGGELGPFATGIVYCRTVCASLDTLDYQRALEWTDAIERAGSDACMAGFAGDCRAHRASIYVMRGDWEAGEREATTASAEARSLDLRHAGLAENELGTIRLRSGDFIGAEASFLRAHQLGHSAQPGLSLLHLARADVSGARALLQRELDQLPVDSPLRAKFLPSLFEIALASGDLVAAAAARQELTALAMLACSSVLRAEVATADGKLLLAQNDTRAACEALRGAVTLWREAGAPYETGCARVHLARALLQAGDRVSATLELQAARALLEPLGAKPALEQADSVTPG